MREAKFYRVVYINREGGWNSSFAVGGVNSQAAAIEKTKPFTMANWNSRYSRKYKKPIAYIIDQEEFESMKPFEADPNVRH
jgi:hypothetical protein